MKIHIVIRLGIIAILLFLFLRILLFFSNQIKQERSVIFERKEVIEDLIGKDVAIGTDTLTVFEYDWDFDKFVLSNGQRVPFEVVEKRAIQK